MTNAQHTPGPWSQSHREQPDGMWSTEVYCADGHTIAELAWYPRPADERGAIGTYREENARLIAAAPDMLAALIAAEAHFGPFADITVNGAHDPDDVRVVALIRDAIAAASHARKDA